MNWRSCRGRSVLMGVWGTTLMASTCRAQTFTVDFSQRMGPPLVKTKFGVYQTPLTTLPRLLDSVSLLNEINVHDFRYEMGWGKPESLAASQIDGSAQSPRIDFSMVDALVARLKVANVQPLLAMSYCPNPLRSRSEWAGWKDMPSDLKSWGRINEAYSARVKGFDGLSGPNYEIWNEPDMPEPGGKMFFSGGPQEYAQLYDAGAQGLLRGDGDALVGGPAAAWNLAYLTPILSKRIDFASIHAYDNSAGQIEGMRGALAKRPDLPIFLTEYASFSDLPANGPQSRFQGAMRFFRDVKGLLAATDVTKVYWAQWLDAGAAPGMGLITWDGHRKALFNAFKIYGMMPIDRNRVSPDEAQGIEALASSDEHEAGVVLWNTSSAEHSIQLHLEQLPFSQGKMRLFRIDKDNASYVDNPASENLQPLQSLVLGPKTPVVWQGSISGESVLYLQILSRKKANRSSLLSRVTPPLGNFVRNYHWFANRKQDAYADFDPRTWTGRVGMGSRDVATAQIGSVIDVTAPKLKVQVRQSGHLVRVSRNSLFGIRIDFQRKDGAYSRSVLLHNGFYDAGRDTALPWGKGESVPDVVQFQKSMNTGRPFEVNLSRLAPTDWNGRRIILTLVLQDAGRGSWAQIQLARA